MKISEIFLKNFWQDKKNVTIAILVALLFIMPIGQTTNTNELNTLKEEISSLENTISTLEKQLTDLKSKNTDLEEEKQNLEKENNQLKETISTNQQETTNTPSQETEETAQKTENNSEMVWIGNTGTKYHTQNCRTLKGNGHEVTMQQALSEGREACKVCH